MFFRCAHYHLLCMLLLCCLALGCASAGWDLRCNEQSCEDPDSCRADKDSCKDPDSCMTLNACWAYNLYEKAERLQGEKWREAESLLEHAITIVPDDSDDLMVVCWRLIPERDGTQIPKFKWAPLSERKRYHPNRMLRELRGIHSPRSVAIVTILEPGEVFASGIGRPGTRAGGSCKVEIRTRNLGETKMEDYVIRVRSDGFAKKWSRELLLPGEVDVQSFEIPCGTKGRISFGEESDYAPPDMEVEFGY